MSEEDILSTGHVRTKSSSVLGANLSRLGWFLRALKITTSTRTAWSI